MRLFRRIRLRKGKRNVKSEDQEIFRRFAEKKTESFMGVCPFCGEIVTFDMEENTEKLTVICRSCEMVVFYLDKLHTPPYERSLSDLQQLSRLDFE